jgi:hypothetical protein
MKERRRSVLASLLVYVVDPARSEDDITGMCVLLLFPCVATSRRRNMASPRPRAASCGVFERWHSVDTSDTIGVCVFRC